MLISLVTGENKLLQLDIMLIKVSLNSLAIKFLHFVVNNSQAPEDENSVLVI